MIIELTLSKLAIASAIAVVFFIFGLVLGIAITLFLTIFPQWKKRLELLRFLINHRKEIEEMYKEEKESEKF